MQSILFVCTANQCRSPIAAALFKNLLLQKGFSSDEWIVESAGTWTKSGLRALPACRKIAALFDVDLSSHRTKSITDVSLMSYDLIIVMEKGHYEALSLEFAGIHGKLYLLSTLAGIRGKNIPDPVTASYEVAVEVMREMAEYIRLAFGPICLLALKTSM